jgi:hypothetical protein
MESATSEWHRPVLFDDFGVDPLHETSELLADLFDLMFSFETAGGFESWCSGFVFQDPFFCELAGL